MLTYYFRHQRHANAAGGIGMLCIVSAEDETLVDNGGEKSQKEEVGV